LSILLEEILSPLLGGKGNRCTKYNSFFILLLSNITGAWSTLAPPQGRRYIGFLILKLKQA
jgi:hypothetical protein